MHDLETIKARNKAKANGETDPVTGHDPSTDEQIRRFQNRNMKELDDVDHKTAGVVMLRNAAIEMAAAGSPNAARYIQTVADDMSDGELDD